MREREMYERVQQFLKVRMRAMVLPATLGFSLALGGCPDDGQETSDDGGSSTVKQDGSAITPVYSAAMPDAGLLDAMATKYLAQLPDAGPVALYMAQSPDAGIAVRYMAQQPDAGGMVALYMALNPS